jgi:hypothetical protein
LLPDFIDGADVGIVQCRSSLAFPLEACQSLGILGYTFDGRREGDPLGAPFVVGKMKVLMWVEDGFAQFPWAGRTVQVQVRL